MWEPAVREHHSFHEESSGGYRKDAARPMFGIMKDNWPMKTLRLSWQVEEEPRVSHGAVSK